MSRPCRSKIHVPEDDLSLVPAGHSQGAVRADRDAVQFADGPFQGLEGRKGDRIPIAGLPVAANRQDEATGGVDRQTSEVRTPWGRALCSAAVRQVPALDYSVVANEQGFSVWGEGQPGEEGRGGPAEFRDDSTVLPVPDDEGVFGLGSSAKSFLSDPTPAPFARGGSRKIPPGLPL